MTRDPNAGNVRRRNRLGSVGVIWRGWRKTTLTPDPVGQTVKSPACSPCAHFDSVETSGPSSSDPDETVPASTADEPEEGARYTRAVYAAYVRRVLDAYHVQSYDEWVRWNRYLDASDAVREVDVQPDT